MNEFMLHHLLSFKDNCNKKNGLIIYWERNREDQTAQFLSLVQETGSSHGALCTAHSYLLKMRIK